ncbi:MAG: aldehyde dehydrogenase family protein, partial [Gemmatimonadota bacterium]
MTTIAVKPQQGESDTPPLGETIPHFIDGTRRPIAPNQRSGDVFNPTEGRVARRVAFADEAIVNDAVNAARRAFEQWADTSPLKRARVMFRFRELIDAQRDELARIIATEHGKVLADALGEVQRGL